MEIFNRRGEDLYRSNWIGLGLGEISFITFWSGKIFRDPLF